MTRQEEENRSPATEDATETNWLATHESLSQIVLAAPDSKEVVIGNLTYHPKFNKRAKIHFLSVRVWNRATHDTDLARIKIIKHKCDPATIACIVREMTDTLIEFLGKPETDWYVTAAPAGVSAYEGTAHFATLLARRVAHNVGLEYIQIFAPRPRSSSSTPKNFDKRGELITLGDLPTRSCIFIDDISTSGTTVLECMTRLQSAATQVEAVVWLYGQVK